MEIGIKRVEQQGNHYTIDYTLEQPLPFDLHDIVMVQAGDYVVGSVRELDRERITLHINEDELQWGQKAIIQLAFSPLLSIEGSAAVVEQLGYFPDFEQAIITDYDIGKERVQLTVELADPALTQAVKLTFLEASDVEFSPPDARLNVIAQMDFRYEVTDLVVDIEAAQGLSGSFFCGKIKAELVER
ncbi:Imm50 family immunity protein [Paenibacillus campi]|uniref:Imm50 family immunity protein n=1 Tax=Paenibacillus campi TaxID=3106031 RepID=UPI002AFEA43C|nr:MULTISPECIES: Imm50 family immunity protein [unclassified Paenibacillus]